MLWKTLKLWKAMKLWKRLKLRETLKLWNGKVEIQVGGVYANGYAWRTRIVEKDVRGALYEEVMR